MLTRREIFRLFGVCCVCGLPGRTSAQTPRIYVPPSTHGIVVCGNEPGSSATFSPDQRLIRSDSGIPELDRNIALERRTLDYIFGFVNATGTRNWGRPSFDFYDDRGRRIGARAVRKDNDEATIYLGLSMIQDEVRANTMHWQVVIIGTLAHEWAHAYQYKSQLDERLFRWETHADFLAGWYIGIKQATGTQIDASVFSQALFERGSRLGRFSEDAYGLPQQRVNAMEAGRRFGYAQFRRDGRPDASAAAATGYEVVSRIGASQ
ncbi:hypothetical protein [Xanthobacter versatilis]|uniref:hypothetical protein n=1 Tax=Xanthobacter autotrophicus (strain ATCC BAA-1158 / Py2) TaxID=78245 RepID=UPI00372D3345